MRDRRDGLETVDLYNVFMDGSIYQGKRLVNITSCKLRLDGQEFLTSGFEANINRVPSPEEGKFFIVSGKVFEAFPERKDFVKTEGANYKFELDLWEIQSFLFREQDPEIVNLTPHPVVVQTETGDIVFPVSGIVARVVSRAEKIGTISHQGIEIPVTGTTFGDVENLPESDGNRIFIVSSLVRTAPSMAGRSDLISPDTSPTGCIRDDKGQIIAVRGFQK